MFIVTILYSLFFILLTSTLVIYYYSFSFDLCWHFISLSSEDDTTSELLNIVGRLTHTVDPMGLYTIATVTMGYRRVASQALIQNGRSNIQSWPLVSWQQTLLRPLLYSYIWTWIPMRLYTECTSSVNTSICISNDLLFSMQVITMILLKHVIVSN